MKKAALAGGKQERGLSTDDFVEPHPQGRSPGDRNSLRDTAVRKVVAGRYTFF
ncbi:hypothetical protein [Paenibacillus chibensis]|uniref:hypothetical protein n=1 Tax=Paenibacillus chibensis TaxID=59846 RepID=UPI0013E2F89B|nr:hypothetical protein [Paenibacillus chibensis]MEC0372871.1 hypothetical protein [Paenibacillus chibensis]